MTTTTNAAASQFRSACINKMIHLKQQQIRIQELRDWLTIEDQEQRDGFPTKDEDLEYDLLVPEQATFG